MALPDFKYPTTTMREGRPALPGQLPIPGVGSYKALFAEKEAPGPSEGDKHAVRISVEQLIESWRKYMGWDKKTMGRVLRTVVREYD